MERGDEIGRLAEAFNAMLERLEDARSSQQRLVADASHELRTPLTSLRTNIELLARGDVPEGDASAMLEDLKSEIFELGAMVSELVDLATIGREDEQAAEVDLRELTAHAVDRARRRSSGIEIRTDLETVRREVKAAAVDRAIANILDNAIKWTPRGGTIEVALDDEGLRVRDSGAGFEADDLPRVFERFYRASSARSHPGSGLGLSIVAAVAADHGWTPFARNAAGGGGEVGIEFGR